MTYDREGFVFNDSEKTVHDPRAGLMFLRNGNNWNRPMGWYDAKNQISRLNHDEFDGISNWRLPTRKELEDMAMYAISAGFGNSRGRVIADYFNNLGFDNIISDYYWTSDIHVSPPDLSNTDSIWCVSMSEKDSDSFHVSDKRFVWPVRDVD